mgnify:CR=1 FL=1
MVFSRKESLLVHPKRHATVIRMKTGAKRDGKLVFVIEYLNSQSKIDDATKTKIMDLYAKGKAEHEAGDHDSSEKDLSEALKLLGM